MTSNDSASTEAPNTVNDPAAAIDRALRTAIELHRDNRGEEAERVYLAILDIVPDHPDVLHFLGVLRHQQGRPQEALGLLHRAAEQIPQHADLHSNLGNVLKHTGKLDAAIVEYREALRLRPGTRGVLSNLGITLLAQGRTTEALGCFRELVAISPDYPYALYHLGLAIRGSGGDLDEAIDCFRRAHTLQADDWPMFRAHGTTELAQTLHAAGRTDEAIALYQNWLALSPNHPVPTHMIAALSGKAPPLRAGDDYVRQLFDQFAGSFDELLVQRLSYRAPELLLDALKSHLPSPPQATLSIIDAGCGTGLCGPLVKPWAARLMGVDLSAGMIAKARERAVYDDLDIGELTEWLDARPSSADLIISADTLVYFGDLAAVLAAAARALRPGGWLAFTLERDADPDLGFHLNPHGRYSHGENHVRARLHSAGFQIEQQDHVIPRREGGRDVQGLLLVARKTAT